MPQTPISRTFSITSSTPTTIYTVPAGATAVVKSVIGTSVIGGSSLTLNKVSGGTTFPITNNGATNNTPASGATLQPSSNFLPAPITLAAGESLSVSTSTASAYKFASRFSSSFTITNVYFYNSLWIAIGTNNANQNGVILTSSDGITWTQTTFTFITSLNDLIFANSVYVAVGTTSGELYTSSDAITWTKRTTPNAVALNAIAYNGTVFVAVGNQGQYITATNPTSTWTLNSVTGSNSNINTVIWANSTWVFGLANYLVATTTTTNAANAQVRYAVASDFGTNAWAMFSSGATFGTLNANRITYTSSDNAETYQLAISTATTANYVILAGTDNIAVNPLSQATAQYWNGSTWTGVPNLGSVGQRWVTYLPQQSSYYYVPFSNTGTLYRNYGPTDNYPNQANPPSSRWAQSAIQTYCTPSQDAVMLFYVQTSNGAIGTFRATTGFTDCGVSTRTVSAVGEPICSAWDGSIFYIFTNQNRILTKANNTSSTLTLLTGLTPVNFNSVAKNSTTIVGVSGTTVYTSSNNGTAWFSQTINNGLATQNFSTNQYANTVIYNENTSKFMLMSTTGFVFTSSDGLTWDVIVGNVQNAQTVNSVPIYVTANGIYTSSTPLTSYTLQSSGTFSAGASKRNISYIGTNYIFTRSGNVSIGSSLSSLSTTTVNASALNNVSYVDTNLSTSNGTSLLVSNGSSFAIESNLNNQLSNAFVTAGIVEIT